MTAQQVGTAVEACTEEGPLRLQMISSRGTKVYPGDTEDTEMIGTWRCRFIREDETAEIADQSIYAVLSRLGDRFAWSNVQKLQVFDGEPGYTKAQGED